MANYSRIIKSECEKFGLNPFMIAAIIYTESGGRIYAHRYEEKFFNNYIKGKLKGKVPGYWPPEGQCTYETEAQARATSWGSMQILGQVAREMGFAGDDLTEIIDPAINISLGVRKFAKHLERENGDIEKALLRWNGGGDPKYPGRVLENFKTGAGNFLLLVGM